MGGGTQYVPLSLRHRTNSFPVVSASNTLQCFIRHMDVHSVTNEEDTMTTSMVSLEIHLLTPSILIVSAVSEWRLCAPVQQVVVTVMKLFVSGWVSNSLTDNWKLVTIN